MNIKDDSRKVKKGDIFIALKTINNDGHKYVEDAIKNGASQVIVEKGIYDVDTLVVPNTREYLIKYLKDNYYPEIEDLRLIGMTGTNGKTTTCFLTHKTLNKLGIKCGYIGTLGFYIDEKIRDLSNTTPDILELYELLIECKENGCKCVVMEVSSQALSMQRVEGLEFDYTIFSNFTKDHLDYHGTIENYALAKQLLFKKLKKDGKAIVNIDDKYNHYFLLKENNNISYGAKKSDYQILEYNMDGEKTTFKIKNKEQAETYEMKLLGAYNVYNMLIIIIVLKDLGFSYKQINKMVSELDAPKGRMDTVFYGTNRIIVDYAHTPDAVKNVIMAAKEMKHNNIYTIVGCGGNRDKTKRPEMARIATELSTKAIFTSDNPRFEKPMDIINDMLQGLDNFNYEIEENREEAIKKGIQMLKENDILLILGKGHETYQIIGDKKIDFDDKEKVLNIIRR
ncbi:MAG: UDP-N-acetylmuramoyl-L-alanyl-D-glutamate--2,6-diaminopimelate ligase [Mollicutes bacterium]|nr:UDP-N-acetylmuramoyl-L-alanyl-D-glutamate--2,6-diaminopimelate ligase [Mollicutes bacterium]